MNERVERDLALVEQFRRLHLRVDEEAAERHAVSRKIAELEERLARLEAKAVIDDDLKAQARFDELCMRVDQLAGKKPGR